MRNYFKWLLLANITVAFAVLWTFAIAELLKCLQ